jgi:predicted aminopeptidase
MHGRSGWVLCFGLVIGALMPGCSTPLSYIPSVIVGELQYLSGTVPIEVALDDPDLTDEQRDKLAFLIRTRNYAHDVVGLKVDNNFQSFVLLNRDVLAWNLSASRKDALEAYIWQLPIVGPLPYLGFFDEGQALAERDRLVDAGYDTFMYQVDTFALWILPDPVASPLLRRSYGSLGDVVMHELLHNTVYKTGATEFNESLAVFVGRMGGLEFLALEFGPDSAEVQETLDAYEDEDRFNAFLLDLADEARALYASDKSREAKLEARAEMFDAAKARFADEVVPLMHDQEGYSRYSEVGFNNAFLVVTTRYYSAQDLFKAVHEMTGSDWPASLAIFNAAAGAGDPFQYLRDRLRS